MKIFQVLEEKGSGVLTARPDEPLLEAARRLASENVGALVVVDGSGSPVGMLSERDVVRALAQAPESAAHIPVGEVMTREILCACPDDEVDDARITMIGRRVRHLPVMGDGVLVGVVSIGDVLKALQGESESENHSLKDYIAGKYL